MTAYVIFRLMVALVLGTIVYIIDYRFGAPLNRWWYGMTHEHPLPPGDRRGFLHGRTTRSRVVCATLVSGFVSILGIIYADYNPLAELLLWLLSIPVFVAAFMIGPRTSALWGKREGVYEAVDKWERGEIDLTDQIKTRSSEIAAGVRNTLSETLEHAGHALPGNAEKQQPEADEPKVSSVEPTENPQELVNRFLKRGQ